MINNNLTSSHITAGIYKHYKGQHYQVLHCARHSETQEWLVVYRCLYDDFSVWVRPMAMFQEQVELSNNQRVPRFSLETATEVTT